MAKQSLNGALQHLRKMAAVQTYRGVSDRELLERFVGARDEAAFTVLIERHGPMVLGVCRRALPNFHDAEDACQATFLVLARKAPSVRKKASLSSWLHGVACRVAAKLTRDYARRKNRERRTDAPTPTDPAAEVTWREVQTILDEELQRLPDRYRTPLILCYLECMTRDEAAQQLSLSPGSLHGRLERARDLLREHLNKRGLTLSAVMTAAALGEGVVQAALAPTIVVSSIKAATLLAAGQPLTESVVATKVLALTQEVLKSMFLTKLKVGTAAALCIGLFAAMIGGSFTSLSIAQDAKPKSPPQTLDRPSANAESDEAFIRRISKDLRGAEPTPAEIHFFTASKDAGRRQKLIDLFIQERQARKAVDEETARTRIDLLILDRLSRDAASDEQFMRRILLDLTGQPPTPAEVRDFLKSTDPDKRAKLIDRLLTSEGYPNQWARAWYDVMAAYRSMPTGLESLQKEFYKDLHAAKEKAEVAKLTQSYLDRLIVYVNANPKSRDISDAIRQIVLVYEAQGKAVEAGAWRNVLPKERTKPSSGSAPKVINQEPQSKAKSLAGGPATTTFIGDLAVTLPFSGPTLEEILQALPAKTRPKVARIQCELLNYQLNAPRAYPLVGPARLAHAHFKCTVFTDAAIEVVYLDRDQLILQDRVEQK